MFKKRGQFFKRTSKRQGLSLVLLLIFLLLPAMAFSAGLVPCGGPGEPACQICHFFVEFDNVVRFVLFKLVLPVAVLMFVIAGINFFAAADSPTRAKKGIEIFRYTTFGLVLVFGAWLLVNVFFDFIGVADWTGLKGGGWSVIDCPLDLAEQGSFFALSPDKVSIDKGDRFSLNLGLNVDQPLAEAALGLNFDPNLLVLEEIIVHPANSNFKTFLPSTFTPAGEFIFDKDKVKTDANSSGEVRIDAIIFDFESGTFLPPQSQNIETFVTLIFTAKEKGESSLELDLAESKLVPAAGPLTNIHKAREQKVTVTVL